MTVAQSINEFRHRDGRYTQEQILSGGAPMVAWLLWIAPRPADPIRLSRTVAIVAKAFAQSEETR